MNQTPISYFGVKNTYDYKAVKRTSLDDMPNVVADVIFDELISNKTFIKEAKEARKKLLKNPKKFPNLSLKHKSFIEK